jgi:hypothetical protein
LLLSIPHGSGTVRTHDQLAGAEGVFLSRLDADAFQEKMAVFR